MLLTVAVHPMNHVVDNTSSIRPRRSPGGLRCEFGWLGHVGFEDVSFPRASEPADPLQRIADLPGITEAVHETRAIVDTLLSHRVLRRRSSDVSMEAALRGARASALLEGAPPITLEETRSGKYDDPSVKGALRVSGEIGSLVDIWPKAPRQVLARLHTLSAADAVPSTDLGRPRTGDDSIPDPLGVGPAPAPERLSIRLDVLTDLLTTR